jgi:hypothetical protein
MIYGKTRVGLFRKTGEHPAQSLLEIMTLDRYGDEAHIADRLRFGGSP